MTFYAPEKIGKKRRLTPEGFLLVEGTPIARTGFQAYLGSELKAEIAESADRDGVVQIRRSPKAVFDPDSMASYNGKSFVNEHPDEMINPENYKLYTCGVVINPRRGEGEERDLLIADLLVQDAAAIRLIDEGKVELSCGYNPEYVEYEPGKWEQVNIIGNHVALVEAGRCGFRCAIGDHQPSCNQEAPHMAKKTLLESFKAKFGVVTDADLIKALDKKDEEVAEAAEPVHVHIHNGGAADAEEDPMAALSARMDGLESMMGDVAEFFKGEKDRRAKDAKDAKDAEEEKEAKEKAEKEANDKKDEDVGEELEEEGADKAAKDSAPLATIFQSVVATAEIIFPGITPPVMDAKAKPRVTLDSICGHRRNTLIAAYATEAGKALIEDLNGGRAFDAAKSPCDRVRGVFLATGAAMKRANNGGFGRTALSTGDKARPPIASISDLSRRAEDLYPPRKRAH